MRIHPLPPMHTLVAFEAAVRHGSFTRAARELNLSQSALSRQILALEAYLGRTLFVREPRHLKLTRAGERYAPQVRDLLQTCARATGEVMKHAGENELTLACSSGIAQFWLTPRLSRFHAEHPEIHLNLIVRDGVNTLSGFEFDFGLYYLRRYPPPGFHARQLLPEEVLPVCAPALLNGRRLTPLELTEQTLLVLEDAQSPWMSWADWFRQHDISDLSRTRTLAFNLYPPLVEMAVLGQGVVLGWRHIIDSRLESGALVPASDHTASHGGGFHLLTPVDRRENRAMRVFRRWLLAQTPTADQGAEQMQ
ncbi:LysR substrate-binding domain-containing protein [Kushneria phosphatilytica]|uniref:LysR family transcriptional regulator n=1 Tax=Kushneria phosphatilytica TaxID=657387 RepID=A0A1S1NSS9_9GAMM|nr:LysR substrate-binding domain-containing protein [Kushneria phosphatilytica]OHV08394.1 LysR family transcriptional regulator [Kushneria phosphatilytica]QEL09817.1 LysR family transcriptional regulator [Kushneria phosphatilytica]